MAQRQTAPRNTQSIGYDAEAQELDIQFQSNLTVYRYSNVPENLYRWLVRRKKRGEPSIGQDFYSTIRPRPDLYPYAKLGPDDIPRIGR